MKTLVLILLISILSVPVFAQAEIQIPGADGEIVFTFIADTPDPVMRQIPREITAKRQTAPAEFVTLLAEFIDEKAECEFDRVKKVHDWIALNIRYDTQSFFSGRYASQAADAVIRRGNAVCAGYAEAFKMICDALKIECLVVSGYARGYGRKLFDAENTYDSNHAWNIVIINKKGYLIDTTWDAGHVSGQSFQARYKTEYLFADPAVFIYDHFPEYSAHQLLDPPLTANEFTNLPFLKPRFFAGFKSWPALSRITEVNAGEKFELEFVLNEGFEVSFHWYTFSGGQISRTYPSVSEKYIVNIPNRTGRIFLRTYIKGPGDRMYWSCGEFAFHVK